MRKKRPILRKEGLNRDASLVVIASEDRYAVKQYFEFFRSPRIQFRVLETDDGNSSPGHVMERLCNFMKEFNFDEGDQFWLVCDTDHWITSNHIQNLVEVMKQCRQKGIGVALSNPCFDLWLLLHFADFPTEDSLNCTEVDNQLRAVLGSYNKKKIHELPVNNGNVQKAITRSKANFDSSCDIPPEIQTAVHLIIESLIARDIITIPA